jgi:hypothetical protein
MSIGDCAYTPTEHIASVYIEVDAREDIKNQFCLYVNQLCDHIAMVLES